MTQSDLLYIGSALAAIGLWALAIGALYLVVEGVYWIYCKATGKEY